MPARLSVQLDKKKHDVHSTIPVSELAAVVSDTSCGGESGVPVEHRFLEILEYISLSVFALKSVYVCA